MGESHESGPDRRQFLGDLALGAGAAALGAAGATAAAAAEKGNTSAGT